MNAKGHECPGGTVAAASPPQAVPAASRRGTYRRRSGGTGTGRSFRAARCRRNCLRQDAAATPSPRPPDRGGGPWLGPAPAELEYAPAPVDNPLKGLVPYVSASGKDRFPQSMEFRYFPLKAVMTGPKTFDWSPIDKTLEEVRGRGNQLIFRLYLEYPGKGNEVPEFLLEQGVKVTEWKDDDGTGVLHAGLRESEVADRLEGSRLRRWAIATMRIRGWPSSLPGCWGSGASGTTIRGRRSFGHRRKFSGK